MTHHSVFRAATALRTLPVIAVTLLIGVLVGCDTVEIRTGEEAETTPNEVTIQSDDFTRADLLFEPVSLASGETFSIDLMDEELGGQVTRITHEGISDDRHLLRAQFDPLNPASVEVQCRDKKAGTQQTMATLGGTALKSGTVSGVARSHAEPTSYHYIQDGPTTVVEVDYDQESETNGIDPGGVFKFPASDRPVQCTHVAFVMEDVSSTLTADGIQFEGDRPSFRKKRVE
ncbi:MAG: hypothetical protein V5A22_11530 [Salinivenus sp.]